MVRAMKFLPLLVVALAAFLMAPGPCGGGSSQNPGNGDEGEGEGASTGEGEGAHASGEGEGANASSEGEGASGGEGQSAGEGEGAGGEGEGEGPPSNANCPDVPLANNPCLPGCGNDKFVGQPCTKGGNECAGHNFFAGEATFCTLDWSADAALAMCTKPCGADSDCGNDAVCISDPNDPGGSKGCVPSACATAP